MAQVAENVLARYASKYKMGSLYGMILCNARAIGEFGAVSVVSGHVRGITNTMPPILKFCTMNINFQQRFAVATLMSLIAVFTLVIKTGLNGEWKTTIRGDYGEYSNSRCIKAIWYISSTSRHSFGYSKRRTCCLIRPIRFWENDVITHYCRIRRSGWRLYFI